MDPSISEFINHPSYHQVAAFFLGFVFISCVHFTCHVPFVAARRIRSMLERRRAVHQGGLGLEANRSPVDEKVNGWLGSGRSAASDSLPRKPESNYIALSLTISFAMSSAAEFGTLLVFDAKNGEAGCAFLVAWGGMAAQAARLLGLLKLSLDLKKMGVRKWETLVFWGWLIFALVVMFASNALSTGTIRSFPPPQQGGPPFPQQNALCYRKHFLGTAVVQSAIDIILEVYCFVRIYYLIVPAFLSARHKLDALSDVRVYRALSLLILDVASAAPSAHFFNILADFIPSSIGSLLVLAAFNYRSPDVTLASTASIPGTRPDSLHSRSTIDIKRMPSAHSLVDPFHRVSHPFAASALQDPAPETEDWPESASPDDPEKPYLSYPEPIASARPRRQTWRSSVQSTVSESDSEVARSVKGAVVAFAFKDSSGQGRRQRDRRSFLPAMPGVSEVPQGVLPRTTPLRIPRPVAPAQAPYVDAIERASRRDRDRPPPSTPSPIQYSQPHISIISATPVTSQLAPVPEPQLQPQPQPQPQPQSQPQSQSQSQSQSRQGSEPSSHRPSISITVPSESNSGKSLHLTPTTPAGASRRASSSESDWPYDERHDSFGSQPSSDEVSLTQAHRQSGASSSSRLPPADDDLSIVYEASHEDSDSLPPSRAYRPTFGEHMFVEGGLGRPTTPADVPEDVGEGGHSNGSSGSIKTPSSSGSKR